MLKFLAGSSKALLSARTTPSRFLSSSTSRFSEFDELKDQSATKKNATTVFDIDELIANSPDLVDGNQARKRYDDFSFGSSAKDPREVAKSFNITGPASGRSVDVKFNNVGFAIGSVYSILRTNNVRSQWNLQKRFIRPAKYRKEKHRKWWRKQFAKGFSDLMAQVTDAKRRGY